MQSLAKAKQSKSKTTKALKMVHRNSIAAMFNQGEPIIEEENKNTNGDESIEIDTHAMRIINAPEEMWTKYKNIISSKGNRKNLIRMLMEPKASLYNCEEFCRHLLKGVELEDPNEEIFAISSIIDLFHEVSLSNNGLQSISLKQVRKEISTTDQLNGIEIIRLIQLTKES